MGNPSLWSTMAVHTPSSSRAGQTGEKAQDPFRRPLLEQLCGAVVGVEPAVPVTFEDEVDLLHGGPVDFLYLADQQGYVLFVGEMDDELVDGPTVIAFDDLHRH